ncbi:MAG: hypothetical protein ABI318_15930 [Chthoniobacteraceae bacterium]
MTPIDKPGIREILIDALRFWEWRRLFYNLVLAGVVLFEFARQWPQSRHALQVQPLLTLFLLAVLANAAYCAAYLVELLVQHSDFRESWRKCRIALWLLGTAFAAVLAWFFHA